MRIGFDATSAVRQGGGIGRYVRELLRALAEADRDNRYRVLIASPSPVPFPLPPLPANFTVRRLPVHDIWLARLWHRARVPAPVEVVLGRVDLYHSPDFTLPPVLPGTPTLLTVHDLSFIRDPESSPLALRNYLNRVVPRSVARAGHVLADSQATKDDLVALYGAPADKVSVLYGGVDERFRPVKDAARLAAARSKYGLGDAPFILAVSTLQPRKNHLRLIRAFASLAARHPSLLLVIAGGKGWLYDAIFSEVQRLGLVERVRFPGFVADADLPALYSAAGALAYPSLYEGFGLPVLEAMACGTPAVVSTAPCLPEVAGEAALQVDPLDVAALAAALERLLTDEGLRGELVARGLARARLFTWARAAEELVGLYQALARRQTVC